MSKVADMEESRDKWKNDYKLYKEKFEQAQVKLEKAEQELKNRQMEVEELKKKLR
jgi:lipase chaperone LimK